MNKKAINQQRGSIILPFVVSLLVGLILLGGVQVGYYFFMKRELQNTADLAVLSGVQMLSEGCAAAKATGEANIEQNFKHSKIDDLKLSIDCGTWDPTKEKKAVEADPGNGIAAELAEYESPQFFEPKPSNEKFNALRVSINYDALPFMPFSAGSTIAVEAIAKSNVPVAAFQVGSQLLRLDPEAPLGTLLSFVGLDIDNLTLLDSKGLANTKISPSGLLKMLGLDIGVDGLSALTPEKVASLKKVTALQLIDDVSLELVEPGTTLALGLEALKTKLANISIGETSLLNMAIPFGGGEGQSGLFAFLDIGNQDPLGGALDVQLGLGDILKTAIAVASNGHALEVPELNLLGAINAKLTIVEPPVIAIGPVGTTGHSAQIRLWLDIDTANLLKDIPLVGLIVKALVNDTLGTRVHLPVALDVVSADGELTKLQCSKNPPTMDVEVTSRILNVCVGGLTENDIFSKEKSCHNISSFKTTKTELIRLLHVPVLSGKLHIPALTDKDTIKELPVGSLEFTEPNGVSLGDTVNDIVDGLLALLNGLFKKPGINNFPDDWTWAGDPYDEGNRILGMAVTYLEEAGKNGLGRYNINQANNLMIIGRGVEGDENYLPPLLEENFIIPDSIPGSLLGCGTLGLAKCPDKDGTFTQVYYNSVMVEGGLLGINSCSGLLGLGSSKDFNNCAKENLVTLLKQNSQHLTSFTPDQINESILDMDVGKSCSGLLCVVLKPIVEVLRGPLNGIGGVLASLLDNVLGLELGRTGVTALAIDCDPAQLVY